LEQIIGRKPISLEEVLTKNASAFKAWSRSCIRYYHHAAAQNILEE
jgi:hypothetical protein